MTWTSVSNEVYEIDEADVLATNSDGSTTWNTLYTQYPSQGTNTFWLDTGNYLQAPPIVHPQYSPMRYYRIVDSGPDTTSDEPIVSIVTPTNSFTASGNLTITVAANTDQPFFSGTLLYVDGQEMRMADSSTNYADGSTNYELDTYTINTCEWPNGPHILFATAAVASALQGLSDVPVAFGHGVSPFVPITFNNLVTRISFSQQFFNPAAGQTQQVTAVFPLNVDWTLQIVDIATNLVQTASGSGVSMLYNWNGTDTNGVTVPPGVYHYLVSAATNGLPIPQVTGRGGGGGGGPPGPDSATIAGSTTIAGPPAPGTIPKELYPPGMAVPPDPPGHHIPVMLAPEKPVVAAPASRNRTLVGGASPDDSPGGSGGSSPAATPTPQNSPPAPVRPSTAPVAGISVTYGIAYDTYTGSANGTNGYSMSLPPNEFGFPTIQMDGSTSNHVSFAPIPETKKEVDNFMFDMDLFASWSPSFVLGDDQFTIGQLEGAGTIFNSVNLGILLGHGDYGSGEYPDYTGGANGSFQIYFPITAGKGALWLKMSQMSLGGAGTNGLKWMAILACHSLYHANWTSMQSHNALPYNSNLHLLLGVASLMPTTGREHILGRWGGDMVLGTNGFPMTIHDAWFDAAIRGYAATGVNYGSDPIVFAVAGDAACVGDFILTNSTPTGSPHYDDQKVWP